MVVGFLLVVIISMAVIMVVALPHVRGGSPVLTERGEQLTRDARDKATALAQGAAGAVSDVVSGAGRQNATPTTPAIAENAPPMAEHAPPIAENARPAAGPTAPVPGSPAGSTAAPSAGSTGDHERGQQPSGRPATRPAGKADRSRPGGGRSKRPGADTPRSR